MSVAVAASALSLIELIQPGDRLYREGVSWDEYEELLDELDGVRSVRVSYDQGRMEIMSVSPEHEMPTGLFTHLVQVLTEELNLEFVSCGSTTLKSRRHRKGTEPDDCFYIEDLSRILGKKRLDLDYDLPPDLAIEVDVTNPTLNKLSIYAGLGVTEVWRYQDGRLEFYRLEQGRYIVAATSQLFPFLSPDIVVGVLHIGDAEGINAMRREFRQWVQANKPKEK